VKNSQLGRIRSEGFADSHFFDAPVHQRFWVKGTRPEVEVGGVAPPSETLTVLAAGKRDRLDLVSLPPSGSR
jgi:hypothetical protein